jgi:hypothetical protein
MIFLAAAQQEIADAGKDCHVLEAIILLDIGLRDWRLRCRCDWGFVAL